MAEVNSTIVLGLTGYKKNMVYVLVNYNGNYYQCGLSANGDAKVVGGSYSKFDGEFNIASVLLPAEHIGNKNWLGDEDKENIKYFSSRWLKAYTDYMAELANKEGV
nr:MAG TPA: hypothetical protein [Caudoviricetes sp.]